MTTQYIKKLIFYCLCLSILLVKSIFANFTLGNSGITFSGGGRVENNTDFVTHHDYGKYNHGRYVTNKAYVRLDAVFNGTHLLNNIGNVIWELAGRLYTFNKEESTDIPRTAYIAIETKLGTLQAGKIYTPTDNIMLLNAINGDLFAGLSASYLLETNLDANYRTDGAQEELTYVAQYHSAIQYSLPKDLVNGLEVKLLVATDPNANQNGPDKKVNTQYPWGIDSSIKYNAENGFVIGASYSESHTLGMDGKFKGSLIHNAYPGSLKYWVKEYLSIHRVVTGKIGYIKDGLNITAGYRNIYYKRTLNDIEFYEFTHTGISVWETNVKTTKYSVDHSYALTFDASYKLGNNNFAIGYEVKPKYTDLRINLITVLYGYNFSDNVTLETQLNHFFNTERPEPEDFKSTKNGFIKNSVTSLTTRLKFTF